MPTRVKAASCPASVEQAISNKTSPIVRIDLPPEGKDRGMVTPSTAMVKGSRQDRSTHRKSLNFQEGHGLYAGVENYAHPACPARKVSLSLANWAILTQSPQNFHSMSIGIVYAQPHGLTRGLTLRHVSRSPSPRGFDAFALVAKVALET